MKRLTLLVIILSCYITFSQSSEANFVYNDEGLNPKSVSIEISGMSKEEMLSKANEWLEAKYGNPEETEESDDDGSEDGKLDADGKKRKAKNLNSKGLPAILFAIPKMKTTVVKILNTQFS